MGETSNFSCHCLLTCVTVLNSCAVTLKQPFDKCPHSAGPNEAVPTKTQVQEHTPTHTEVISAAGRQTSAVLITSTGNAGEIVKD